ncbi:glutathione S-transferase C-terminal-like protein [Lentinus tigrinus ALCF2SS1-7]|uniref:glutathione S-transferase C-terminal-like protein n=1 Tax=Lentinus tigrinus ALCF2SS1-7 TaxID=1328758 RepID=UPI0011660201|nr:glutathione S-transferase C-terminal-like protein [Lentinus tigrinus ALCF2SS1-7]
MSHDQQFTLYTHARGPNGWKVAFVLEELGLSYHSIYLDFDKKEQKAPEHTQYNPNGRIPTLIDHHNGDFVIWESNAIILYLVDKYDKEAKISVTDEKDKYTLLQWLFFQASGQGPYYGQAFWFTYAHPEKVPSAVERYENEILRVLGVLDGVLAKEPSGWLVGGKCTVADLSFVPWDLLALTLGFKDRADVDVAKTYPAFYAWHQKLLKRESVAKLLEVRANLMK